MEMIKDTLHEGHYTVAEGYVIVRKDEHSVQTESLWLGKTDIIDNYEVIEKPIEKEELDG